MNGLIRSRRRRALVALSTLALAFAAGGFTAWAADAPPSTTVGSSSANGITRTALGQASPENAPGQTLYLQRVTIAAGAKLAEHFHEGTQLARVISGTLTYNIISGTVAITHTNGDSENVVGPKVLRLRAGDSLTEAAGLVHYGANNTKKKASSSSPRCSRRARRSPRPSAPSPVTRCTSRRASSRRTASSSPWAPTARWCSAGTTSSARRR